MPWDGFHKATHPVWYKSPGTQSNPFVRFGPATGMLVITEEPKHGDHSRLQGMISENQNDICMNYKNMPNSNLGII